MSTIEYKDLLDAGCHFGHLTRKWNPKMASYIFMERNGIHIIDLNKTLAALKDAAASLKSLVRSGKKVMFVATKKQAKEIVAREATRLKMPYVTERWLGGMLTNFITIRKSLKKMQSIERMLKDENTVKYLPKKEVARLMREKEKLAKVLGGVADQTRLPSALFVVDVKREAIAVQEARRLNIPVYAIVDTNSDPDLADFVIPANDDAYKSIHLITSYIGQAIEEGIQERKRERDEQKLAEIEAEKREEDDEFDEEARKKRKRSKLLEEVAGNEDEE
ncbi:MAG: 30S ribosomal protein S2 [Cytophagales bacterium]|nr:30S ribosomal protein S2 [Cytophagales bacterium]MDW8384854.1 30S ribosomal protein S2 [Flammeovirgaceae bacterium]